MAHEYHTIGLKAGLEIHQQLNTTKLFCSCPSILRNDSPQCIVSRVQNPVVGETGIIDVAAAFEASQKKTFDYQVFDSNCLVELDEEPPHSINSEALRIALQISYLLHCTPFPVAQVMRKTVVDGSNTSGFQRTVLIAHEGYIETSEGRVGIDSVALEEDSARKVSEKEGVVVYRLDRLGIPLVEIATKPDLKTASQIKEAALKLGEILRACNVKRGIGTIRQDVNISLRGSKRVEIKGFQDPKMMLTTIDTEISRQKVCLEKGECVSEVRNALPDGTSEFLRPMPGSARMYPETDVSLLVLSRELLDSVKKDLPKLSSEHASYLKEFGLTDELISVLLKRGKVEEFKSLSHITSNPELIAKCLTLFPVALSKKTNKTFEEISKILNEHALEGVLEAVERGSISATDVRMVLERLVNGVSLTEALEKEDVNLDTEVARIVKEKPGLTESAYMGLVMKEFKGRVSGKDVHSALQNVLG